MWDSFPFYCSSEETEVRAINDQDTAFQTI